MSDKVRNLAEKLEYEFRPPTASGMNVAYARIAERIIRDELEPLLEKAHNYLRGGSAHNAVQLSEELQHWHSMERTPER